MKRLFKSIYLYLTARFSKLQLLAIIALVIFAFFISDGNIFSRLSYDSKIRDLNNQIEFYRDQTAKNKERLRQLDSNDDDIERFARENYLMKKAGEDIFVIE